MCATLHFRDREIVTVGELRKLMPVLIGAAHYPASITENDICLCPINMEATAEANGFKIHLDDNGDYTVVETPKG